MAMLKIKVDTNSMSGLVDVSRQNKFATMVALNRTAGFNAQEVKLEMVKIFDRPTRYIMNGVRVEEARMKGVGTQSKYTKQRYIGEDRMVAEVFFKDEKYKRSSVAADMMAPHTQWGYRKQKPFEEALQRVGVLKSGEFAIPTANITLNKYGNPSHGQIIQMLSHFQAFPESGYFMNKKRKADAKLKKPRPETNFWVAWTKGKKYRAIYTYDKSKKAVPIWLLINKTPTYDLIFPFYNIAEENFNKNFEQQYDIAFKEAMATARRY